VGACYVGGSSGCITNTLDRLQPAASKQQQQQQQQLQQMKAAEACGHLSQPSRLTSPKMLNATGGHLVTESAVEVEVPTKV